MLRHQSVSKLHARFHIENEGAEPGAPGDLWLTDMRSTAGTTVNDAPLIQSEPRPLRPGDDIRLGQVVCQTLRRNSWTGINPGFFVSHHETTNRRTCLGLRVEGGIDDLEHVLDRSEILAGAMDYDLARPGREDADLISYSAGHKAMGLYAMWALRDEVARIANPALLPAAVGDRLRLEDLLGFRRNPITATPLFTKHGARALDGHPTPATPFLRLSTGASGVGVASSMDRFFR